MSLVSVLEAVPNRVWAVARLCAAEGPMTRDAIRDRMVPIGEFTNFNLLVNETRRLGLMVIEGEGLRLAPTIKPKDVQLISWFIDFVDRALLTTSGEGEETEGNESVKFALAWLLTCRPGKDLAWNEEQKPRMHEELNGIDYSITNSSRFAMLAYWARFLGYGVGLDMDKRIIVPDPTEAIRRRLGDVFGKDRELPAATFISRLGEQCPVLETGTVRSIVEKRMQRPRGDQEVSPSTSVALLRLEVDGELDLHHKADAQVLLLDLMHGDPKRISHVRRKMAGGIKT